MSIVDDRLNCSDELSLLGAMLSDRGTLRRVNEDRVAYVIPRADESTFPSGVLALVADGMGGHAAGEVASSLAVDAIVHNYYAIDALPGEALRNAFYEANKAIYTTARRHAEFHGMGTTCTAIAVHHGTVYLAHIGDSRCYLLRGSEFHQLSQDHSKVMELVRNGTLTEQQAKERADANVILRALGTHEEVHPNVWQQGLPLQVGDVLLLCSDGLTDLVDNETIQHMLCNERPTDTCRRLIHAALQAGGYDNISVGVFRITTQRPAATNTLRTTRDRTSIQVAK